VLAAVAGAPPDAAAAGWAHWRGPARNGTSPATGLPASWSPAGENLVWRADFVGRSTPVAVGGRICATGRAGEDTTREEVAACWDARDGTPLWERRFPVYHTTVPWNRVGWANPAADPETGYLYVQGVGGLLSCLDSRDGRVVWQHPMIETLGFMEGYGGRTQTPTIDEDKLIVTFASTSWGELVIPRHRVYAFDKRSGELLWISSPASSMEDKNTQSTPAVAVVGGRRLVIHGNGDGWVYANDVHTGEKVWGFNLSKRGLNTSVLVDGTTVYAAHSEENVDEPTMGRVVAIDATGSGDVTATHERWRHQLGVGFSSPALHDGRLYVIDNAANLYALDAADGRELWHEGLGTVGKASPVVADGKIYATEVNGRFVTLAEKLATPEAPRKLSEVQIAIGPREAEVYGSAAVAYGRVYFTTEEGIYCLGLPGTPFAAEDGPAYDPGTAAPAPAPAPAEAPVATLLVMPAEVLAAPGEPVDFRAEAFAALGQPLGTRKASWSLDGLAGSVDDGVFTPDPATPYQEGKVVARLGGEGGPSAAARVRVIAPLPFRDGFEGRAEGQPPPYLVNSANKFVVEQRDGEPVLAKNPSPVQLHSHLSFLGRPEWRGYTIRADVLGTRSGRRVPDVGLINSGYGLELMGAGQRLQVVSWPAARRIASQVPLAWEMDTWMTLALRVDVEGDRAVVRGKAWPRGTPEPAEWTITVEDPAPIRQGSPGLSGYSPSPIYFDNVEVTENR
jgi:outer membrane protein assembly factor BamB